MKKIWITETEVDKLNQLANLAYPNETGGILAGVFMDGYPWITHVMQINPVKIFNNYYLLPKGRRPKVIKNLRKQNKLIGYLGEWHSHPFDIGLSTVDKESIKRIAKDKRANCPNPIIILVRQGNAYNNIEVKQFKRKYLVSMNMILAGSLSEIRGKYE